MTYDIAVVGGSFAGLSAALQVARARRSILMIDANMPRNRFATTAHGFVGHDGKSPAQIRKEALGQLFRYPTFELHQGKALSLAKSEGGFTLDMAGNKTAYARHVIIATGVRDVLPNIPLIADYWGKTVIHCPYCHGYEVAGQQLGVIANHPTAPQQAVMLPDWGPTTYFTQGKFEPDEVHAALMRERGVKIERSNVVALSGKAPQLTAVLLADGRTIPMGAIFTATETPQASTLAAQIGCEFADGPSGQYIKTDMFMRTSVPGIFAAGDAATPAQNATNAAATGVMAGVMAHQSLVRPLPS